MSNTKTDNNQQEANNQTELILKLYNLKRKIANTKDSELKNEYLQIRNIIISQNLQLCATIVYNYCKT